MAIAKRDLERRKQARLQYGLWLGERRFVVRRERRKRLPGVPTTHPNRSLSLGRNQPACSSTQSEGKKPGSNTQNLSIATHDGSRWERSKMPPRVTATIAQKPQPQQKRKACNSTPYKQNISPFASDIDFILRQLVFHGVHQHRQLLRLHRTLRHHLLFDHALKMTQSMLGRARSSEAEPR